MNLDRAFSIAVLPAFLFALVAGPARADLSYNFNNGNDAGLTHYDPLAPFGSGATYSFPVLGAGNDGYRLTSGPSASPTTLGPARVGSYRADQTFGDFRLSVDVVDWNRQFDEAIGLAARLSNVGLGTSSGYSLHYNTDPGTAQLVLERVDAEQPDPNNVGALLTPLDPGVGFRLVFTGIGSTLTGQIFALNDLSHARASVTLIDSTYRSGFVGVLATDLLAGPNVGVDATYDNLQATAVPEPGSAALLATGVVGLVVARKRRPGAKGRV